MKPSLKNPTKKDRLVIKGTKKGQISQRKVGLKAN